MNPELLISAVHAWFADWEQQWRSLDVQARLILPSEARLGKVAVTLDRHSHAASLTVWGGGTFEFIVLDVAAQQEVVMEDREFVTLEDLRQLLDDSAESFRRLLLA